ncbi:MAG: D-aminoacyl-tRNA deacylase [Thermodesulfobacteriota bacterium]|nr:D-aminoacyl-tRNA deacylase [Thermodesulfobacteriota bacterium]
MRAVVQRVKEARVLVYDKLVNKIGSGLLIYLGIKSGDTEKDADYLLNKIINLRIFEDNKGKMNLSLQDVEGEILIISQFTLLGDCRKGRRPSFDFAEGSKMAYVLYNYFLTQTRKCGIVSKEGKFQAKMEIYSVNTGPVTFLLDSEKLF